MSYEHITDNQRVLIANELDRICCIAGSKSAVIEYLGVSEQLFYAWRKFSDIRLQHAINISFKYKSDLKILRPDCYRDYMNVSYFYTPYSSMTEEQLITMRKELELSIVAAGGQVKLAQLLKVTQPLISGWIAEKPDNRVELCVQHVINMHDLFGSRVHKLRPDLYPYKVRE